jgi:hypothetical protein
MKRPLILAFAMGLAGCPSPAKHNPKQVWLDDMPGDETHVRLIDSEPPPF